MAGCRRGDLKWAATTVHNSSTTQPSRYLDVKEADKPHTTKPLLMRAGDVESNPGPKIHSEEEEDFDDILKDVARRIPDNMKIDTLGKALSFDPAEIGRYIATNTSGQHVMYEGTLKMFRDWRNTQAEETERQALADALRLAGLVRLANFFIRTPTVQKLHTTPEDLPQHDLLKSVMKDIKEYYKHNMCIIQADPTDNDVMFKFNRIYTNPTLLKKGRTNKTKKKRLVYRKLLKTKIFGKLPNRLLVQAEGGAGKTTFCSKIAWDWAHGKCFQFKLVAVIPLRKANNKTDGEVIKSYLSDNNPFTAVQIDKYILTNQKDVFLVFDGLDELWGKLSDSNQIVQIILNRLFMSGTVLVTSRQWMAHEIYRITELKKVYAFIYIEGFSLDNVTEYIKKFFRQDAASSQKLIDFIYSNDVIAANMAPFPIFIAMLCSMWKENDGERREAMSKLMTFSQLFDEMIDLLVDHCGSKDPSQTGPTVQELREMIPDHLKAIGEIAFQGILDGRLEFPEDAFQSCGKSMEMGGKSMEMGEKSMEIGCKVGVLTREKHATPRRGRRKNPCLEMSMVQFPHKLFQEYMAAKYLASLHSSHHDRYERIMDNILRHKENIRYLLYFTSAQGSELGLDIVTRLANGEFMFIGAPWNDHFAIDVAYESQHQSVAKKVGNQLREELVIDHTWSAHTLSGLLFIKEHLVKVNALVIQEPCGRTVSQGLAEFILSSASLRTLRVDRPMHDVFYSILANKAQQCKIQNLMILYAHPHDQLQPLASRDLAEFICQMPHLESLALCHTKLHKDFFSKWASIVSLAKVNNRSTTPHTSLRKLRIDPHVVLALQSCGDMFDGVHKLSFSFSHDFKFDFLERVSGFQRVTELTIDESFDHEPYPVTGEPSTMIKHLVRVFPQLIKMTFGIHVGNANLKRILESLRETRGSRLKSVRVLRCEMDDGLDELDALINIINDENVFRVEVQPLEDCTYYIGNSSKESDGTPEGEPGDLKNLCDHQEGGDRQQDEEPGDDSDYETISYDSWLNLDALVASVEDNKTRLVKGLGIHDTSSTDDCSADSYCAKRDNCSATFASRHLLRRQMYRPQLPRRQLPRRHLLRRQLPRRHLPRRHLLRRHLLRRQLLRRQLPRRHLLRRHLLRRHLLRRHLLRRQLLFRKLLRRKLLRRKL